MHGLADLASSLPRTLRFSSDASAYRSDLSGRRGANPLGVVHPASVDQVEQVVRWANRSRIPIVPVSSRGGPRRFGDTICPEPALIVDLSGMNRVIHVDGRDAVAVIEAGVTFDELDTALRPHGLKSFRPLLPRTSKSVMAAFLEREPITVPGHHWDSADPLAALELVFGNGDRFRTGGASLPGTIEQNLERGNRQLLAAGPGQTDFGRLVQGAQGSLGIIARGSILCHQLPAVTVPLFVSGDALPSVVDVAYAMLRKRPEGHLFVVNGAQLAMMLANNANSYAALKAQLPAWTLFVELTASSYFADEAIAYRRFDLENAAGAAGAVVSEMLGGRSAQELSVLLERSPKSDYKQEVAGAYEQVFFTSQLNRVQGFLDVLQGADCPIYLQPMVHGVNAHCEFTFLADDHLTAFNQARLAAERFGAEGAFFSRPYHLWADLAFARDEQIVSLLTTAKDIFDPNGILQPESQALGKSTAAASRVMAAN